MTHFERARLARMLAALAWLACAFAWTAPLAAQQELALGRGPRFMVPAGGGGTPVEVDITKVAVLRHRVSLHQPGATVMELLREITERTGIEFAYEPGIIPVNRVVGLRAESITVAAALTEILVDAGVDVLLKSPQQAVLLKRALPGAVAGRVTDAKSGNGLSGAEVLLEGTPARVLTGEDGRYRLGEVAPGSYTLLVRRPGYGPARRAVTVADAQEVTLDVALEPRPTQLDEVVVTGTLVPTEVKALPSPVTVITAEQIEQQRIRNYSQLLRQLVPGMIAWENAMSPDMNSMSVRGASSLTSLGQLKVYVDGVQIAFNTYSQVDPQSIERIEVIRGPQAAALYGSDAIGGVMEIFTKRGHPALQRLQGSGQVAVGGIQSKYRDGAALRQDYRAELRGARGGTSFNLGGGYARDGAWIDLFAAERPSAFGGMRFEQGRFALDLTARYYGQNFLYGFNPVLQATGYPSYQTPNPGRFEMREETYGVQLRYRMTPSWQHQLIVGADRYSSMYERYRPRLQTPTDTLLEFQELGLNRLSVAYRSAFTARLSPGLDAVLTAGLDYSLWRYSNFLYSGTYNLTGTIASAPTGFTFASRDRTTNAGYFAQAQIGIRDALFLTGSARLEQNSNFGDEIGTPVSPRVGLSYVQPLGGATLKLRSAYGEALTPPLSDQKSGVTSGTATRLPNPELRPERQVGPEMGVDLVIGSRASLGVTYYRQTARDLIARVELQPDGSTTVYRFENVGRVRNEGIEVEGRLDLAGVQLTGQYAYTSSTLLDPGPDYSGVEQIGEQISSVPKHTAGATLTVTPLRRLGVTVGMAYIGPRHEADYLQLFRCLGSTGPCHDYFQTGDLRAFWARIPGFAKFNLSVDYELGRGLTSYLAVENLANSNPVERSSTTALPGRITTVGLRLRY